MFHPVRALLALVLSLMLLPALAPGAAAQGFGAIAYSQSSGQWGWSRNYGSRAGAEARAMQECRSAAGGARDCRSGVWFQNACGALAVGTDGWGTGWGTTQARANAEAIGVCRQHSRNCSVRLQVCSP